MFFFIVVAGIVFQTFLPLGFLKKNSHSYSATPPKRMTGDLPHITIQCMSCSNLSVVDPFD